MGKLTGNKTLLIWQDIWSVYGQAVHLKIFTRIKSILHYSMLHCVSYLSYSLLDHGFLRAQYPVFRSELDMKLHILIKLLHKFEKFRKQIICRLYDSMLLCVIFSRLSRLGSNLGSKLHISIIMIMAYMAYWLTGISPKLLIYTAFQ